MMSLVTGPEYLILLLGLAASVLWGIGAGLVAFLRRRK
jgi:hypothetical protein